MEEFLSTPSARRATYELRRENQQYKRFLSTPSARRATRQDSRQKLGHTISIHALREEGDGGILFRPVMAADDFYPRPPRGGRLTLILPISFFWIFLSTPSARRATFLDESMKTVGYVISIHALREEGDSKNGEKHLRFCFIIKRSAQIWKSLSKNIRKNSCDLHRTA